MPSTRQVVEHAAVAAPRVVGEEGPHGRFRFGGERLTGHLVDPSDHAEVVLAMN